MNHRCKSCHMRVLALLITGARIFCFCKVCIGFTATKMSRHAHLQAYSVLFVVEYVGSVQLV